MTKVNSITINPSCFSNNTFINSVDCGNAKWTDNSMSDAFKNCTALTAVSQISNTITNLDYAFSGCSKLTGNIKIDSGDIISATDCFASTSLRKDVFIPYNTTTYNTLTSLGYDENGSKDGVYLKDSLAKYYTLTINPTPSDATVVLTAEGYVQSGNSIKVKENTSVTYSVSCSGYETKTGDKVVSQDETLDITLEEKKEEIVYAYPYNSTVAAYNVGDSIYVNEGMAISKYDYTAYPCEDAYKNDFTIVTTISEIVTIDDETVFKFVEPEKIEVTVTSDIDDANIVCVTDEPVSVNMIASADDATITTSTVMNKAENSSDNTKLKFINISVSPTVTDNEVTFVVGGVKYNYSDLPLYCATGAWYQFKVNKSGYLEYNTQGLLNDNLTKSVTLTETRTVTVNGTCEDGLNTPYVKLVNKSTGETQVAQGTVTLTVAKGVTVAYTVYYEKYATSTGSIAVDDNKSQDVVINNMASFEIANVSPSSAIISLTTDSAEIVEESDRKIWVIKGSNVSYDVSEYGYNFKNGTETVTTNTSIDVTLETESNVEVYYLDSCVTTNYTTTGTVSIDNGIASGFSTSNYLQMSTSFNTQINSFSNPVWALVAKFNLSSNNVYNPIFGGTSGTFLPDVYVSADNHFGLNLSWNGEYYGITGGENKVFGTYTVLPNTDYYVKFMFKNNRYYLYYSLDGNNWVKDIEWYNSLSTSMKLENTTDKLCLGFRAGQYLHGSIDLENTYAQINGMLVWKYRNTLNTGEIIILSEGEGDKDYWYTGYKNYYTNEHDVTIDAKIVSVDESTHTLIAKPRQRFITVNLVIDSDDVNVDTISGEECEATLNVDQDDATITMSSYTSTSQNTYSQSSHHMHYLTITPAVEDSEVDLVIGGEKIEYSSMPTLVVDGSYYYIRINKEGYEEFYQQGIINDQHNLISITLTEKTEE